MLGNEYDEFMEDMELTLHAGMLSKMAVHALDCANPSDFVVAHTNAAARVPVHQMFVTNSIFKLIQRLDINQLRDIQTHTWQHLNRGDDHGVYIVAPSLSGRTLAFLIPLCHTVSTVIHEQAAVQQTISGSNLAPGPLAIVVASDATRAERIEQLCRLMFHNLPHVDGVTLVATISSYDYESTIYQLVNSVACLVVTLAQFVHLERYSQLSYTELRFVAFDDVDMMESSLLRRAFPYLLNVIGKARQRSAHLVLTAQSYEVLVLQQLCVFNRYPMVVIDDVLEASFYNGVPTRIYLMEVGEKFNFVFEILRLRPPNQWRTLVCCNSDSEVEELANVLTQKGYNCLTHYLSPNRVQPSPSNVSQALGKVLVTADCPHVRNVHTLIHYSLPSTWTAFKKRYRAFTHNLQNFLTTNTVSFPDMRSLVLLDLVNTAQLPRLIDYIKLHKCHVSQHIAEVAQRVREEFAANHMDEPTLCPQLMSYGNCKLLDCSNRHELVAYDHTFVECFTYGDIRFSLQKLYSPVHYCVQLLEYRSRYGDWQKLAEQGAAANTSMRLQSFMHKDKNRLVYWPPVAREVCVCRLDTKVYERVRILTVPHIETTDIARGDLKIQVQSMDTDRRAFWTTSAMLYCCPEEFLALPPSSIDVRLVGLRPRTRERNWLETVTELVRFWLSQMPTNSYWQARVLYSTPHTIFVDKMQLMGYAPNVTDVMLLNMSAKLCERLAHSCYETKSKVLTIFKPEDSYMLSSARLELHDANQIFEKMERLRQRSDQQQSELAADVPQIYRPEAAAQAADDEEGAVQLDAEFYDNIEAWLKDCETHKNDADAVRRGCSTTAANGDVKSHICPH